MLVEKWLESLLLRLLVCKVVVLVIEVIAKLLRIREIVVLLRLGLLEGLVVLRYWGVVTINLGSRLRLLRVEILVLEVENGTTLSN